VDLDEKSLYCAYTKLNQNDMDISQTIVEIRKHRSMTQGELAKIVGITTDDISNIEQRKQNTSQEILGKIADALDVPLEVMQLLSLNEDQIPELKRKMFHQLSGPFKDLLRTAFDLQ